MSVSASTFVNWWRRFISACNASGAKAGQIRARQIFAITRLSPYMMSANVICALMVFAIFWGKGSNSFLIVWSVIIPFAVWTGIKSYRFNRASAAIRNVSELGIKRAILNSFMMGLLWGILPVSLFPGANASEQVFLTCLTAGMLCGTGFALATVPMASIAAIVPIAVGSIVALFLDHSTYWSINCTLVIIYTGAILLTAATQGQNFIHQLMTQDKIEDQNDTIKLLLNEYENNSSDWLWETDQDCRLIVAPKRMAEVLCTSPDSLLTQRLTDLFPVVGSDTSGESTSSIARFQATLDHGDPFRDLVVLTSVNGQSKWISLSGRPIRDRSGVISGYRGVGSDVTTEKSTEARLEHMARYDSLTGVANRMYFGELLSKEITKAKDTGRFLAVFVLDLDNFKLINDTKGHPFGDSLLRAAAQRFITSVGDKGTVARFGGDEFAIILRCERPPHDVETVAENIINAFAAPFEIDGVCVSTTTSIGISIAPTHGDDVGTVIKNADLALYEAKKAGRNRYRQYRSAMGRRLRLSRGLEADLKKASQSDQFSLFYQPLVCSRSRNVCGYEGLMRWHHPDRGMIGPAEFVPIAERTGDICTLGSWAICNAVSAVKHWPDGLTVAINVSPVQFLADDLYRIVSDALERAEVSPDRLELEITEGVLIQNSEQVLLQLEKLKDLGVAISLDDFGTGFSSLSYLWRFPFDKIKIDRSFVSALKHDSSVKDILQMIAMLARSLEATLVAEGVETEDQARFLSDLGCDQLQGRLFGMPKPDHERSANLVHQIGPNDRRVRVPELVPAPKLIAS